MEKEVNQLGWDVYADACLSVAAIKSQLLKNTERLIQRTKGGEIGGLMRTGPSDLPGPIRRLITAPYTRAG